MSSAIPAHSRWFAIPVSDPDPYPVSRCVPATLARRALAMVYDALASLAVAFSAGALAVLFHRGEAIAADNPWFKAYLLLAIYAYFGYSWHRAGQTLGMRSWKIVLFDAKGEHYVSWRQTAVRFAVALLSWLPCGLGFLWSLFDAEHRTWHDRASSSRLVLKQSDP